jgi:WhiB family redox-sensing transcriptional regulator
VTAALRAPVTEELDWQLQSSCRGLVDDSIFFPQLISQARAGKRICLDCPVRPQCLEDALVKGDMFGTRGGLDQWERRKLLQKRP